MAEPFFGRAYRPSAEPQIDFYTAYQHHVGIYHRGDIANFHENRLADNFTSTFITFTQTISDTLFVGHSRGNSDPGEIVTGHTLYDGANTLPGNHFAGYAASNAHTFRTHSAARRHTHHVFSNTSFENDGSAGHVSIATQGGGATHSSAFGFSPSALYDVDGTLTGHVTGGGAGKTVVTDHPFFYDSGDFKPAEWNAWVSDDLYTMLSIDPVNLDADFRFTSPDGDVATMDGNFNTVLKTNDGDYTIDFPEGLSSIAAGFELLHYTRVGPSGSTVIRFKDVGAALEPRNVTRVHGLTNVRNATGTVYDVIDGDIWMKLFSSSSDVILDPSNFPPVAQDDFASTTSETPVQIPVLANDLDPDNDPLTVGPVQGVVADYVDDFQTGTAPAGWQYLWNETSQFGDESGYAALQFDVWRYRPTSRNFPYLGATFAHPGIGTAQDPSGVQRYAVAACTVPQDGFYSIVDSSFSLNAGSVDGVNVAAHISGGDVTPLGSYAAGGSGAFDGDIGFATAGQVIHVGLGGNGTAGGDGSSWDFSIMRSGLPTNGQLTFNPDNTIIYTPDPGAHGVDTFEYQVDDGSGGVDTATVQVTVNDPPTATNDMPFVLQDTPTVISLLNNDSDPDNDPLTVGPVHVYVADYVDDFQTGTPPTGWQYLWNETSEFGVTSGYSAMQWEVWRYHPTTGNFPYVTATGAHPGDGTGEGPGNVQRYAIAAYTVPQDGIYSIANSSFSLNPGSTDGANIAAHITGGSLLPPGQYTAGESGSFDAELGFAMAGQVIHVGLGANGSKGADGSSWDFSIVRDDVPEHGQLVFNLDNTITYTPNAGYLGADSFSYSISDGYGGTDTAIVNLNVAPAASVLSRRLAYGGSTANNYGEDALDWTKQPLLPGETSGAANYSNYSRGINRVVLDIRDLASASLTSADFEFRVGNTDDPSNWLLLDTNSSVPLPTINTTAGLTEGVSRVVLSWPDNSISNAWLQVTLKSNDNTGLATEDVFYFGNQLGDVNGSVSGSGHVNVNSFDTGLVRLNQSAVVQVGIDNVYDIDRNGLVNAFDTGRVRLNQTLGGLIMFTAPAGSPPTAPVLVFAPPNVQSANVVTRETLSQGQRSYIGRLLNRWQANFQEGMSVERQRELILRRLTRIAKRLSLSAESSFAVGDLATGQRRTRMALAINSIADQLRSKPDRTATEIFGDWAN